MSIYNDSFNHFIYLDGLRNVQDLQNLDIVLSDAADLEPQSHLSFTPEEIYNLVYPKIMSRYEPVNQSVLKSKKYNVLIPHAVLDNIVKIACSELSKYEVGKPVIINDSVCKLKYSKNHQLRLVIQTREEGSDLNTHQSKANITPIISMHTGRLSVSKKDTTPNVIEKEYRLLTDTFEEVLRIAEQPDVKGFLRFISPDNSIFIPIIKPSSEYHEDGQSISSMQMARAEHGDALNFFVKRIIPTISDIGQFGLDLLTSIYLLELAKTAHLDVKLNNVGVFNPPSTSTSPLKRYKLFDFGISLKHLKVSDPNQMSNIPLGSLFYQDTLSYNTLSQIATNPYSFKGTPEEFNQLLVRRDRVAAARSIMLLVARSSLVRFDVKHEIYDLEIQNLNQFPKLKRMYEGLTSPNPQDYNIKDAILTMMDIRNSGRLQ